MKSIGPFLEQTYHRYNRPEYIPPDPLETVLPYSGPEDREIAGLIASSLALGNVKAMLPAIRRVFAALPALYRDIEKTTQPELLDVFDGFVYRFFRGRHIAGLITAVRRVIDRHGSLEHCFVECLKEAMEDLPRALERFCSILRGFSEGDLGILVPCPEKKSACKRMMLYLRWMVRNDAVDKGCWDVDPAVLCVPVDTHMLAIARRLGLTRRKQADLKAAVEITEGFRRYAPKDPVKYDFCLTRLGIRPDLSYDNISETFISQD